MSTPATLLDEVEEQMMDVVGALERDLASYRTGKASPALVEGLMVDYYGSPTRLRDIAGITAPEPRLLVIQPWDKSAMQAIEKAILTSNIGISPLNDGKVIRLPVPELSEERRKDLSKQVRRRTEEAKVAIRNQRRDANEAAKKFERDGKMTQDDLHQMLEKVQKLTDGYIANTDEVAEAKVQEIMKL